MLDGDRAMPAALKPANVPTVDSGSTVRSITALPGPTAGGSAGSASPASSLSTPSSGALLDGQAPSAGALGAAPAPTLDRSSPGGSLRDVIQSIVTLHRADNKPAPARRLGQGQTLAATTAGAGPDALNVDLRKLILDSEVAGTMLRSIVEIKSADAHGATFSIFGLGNFALDIAPDLHTAIVSELSSGLAFRMSLTGEGRSYDGLYSQAIVNRESDAPREHVNMLRVFWNWILDFLNSPVGTLLSMAIAIALFLWIGVKSVGFLQRRAQRYDY